MSDWLVQNADYLIFSLLTLCVLLWLGHWLRKTERVGRLPVSLWLLCLVILGCGWFATRQAGLQERQRLEKMVEGFAPTYAQELERMGHEKLSFQTSADDPLYLGMIEAERRWLQVNPSIADVYTLRKNAAGKPAFLVDSETDYDHNGRYEGERESRTPIGEIYEVKAPGLEEAFQGRANFNDSPIVDRWGSWVSAFYPMRDSQGRLEAVLGVDYPAELWAKNIAVSRYTVIGLTAGVLSIILASILIISQLRLQIRRRRQIEEELKRAKLAAEEASRAKSDFLANMSHEIRTPLNGILGIAQLLTDMDSLKERKEYLGLIRESASYLAVLIDDILDFSKIEAGKLDIEYLDFELWDCVGGTLKNLSLRAHSKGLELIGHIDPDLPHFLRGDPKRIRQILTNLLSNAIKFTKRGEVSLEISRENGEENIVELHIRVTDTGIGIPPEKLEVIFSPFMQADNSTTREFGGTGLGLSICWRLVQLMEGRIWAESKVGEGSTFHVILPLMRAEFSLEKRLAPELRNLQGLKVLAVDDNSTNRRILDEFLRLWGLNATLCESADQALQKLTQAANESQPFQLLVSDAQMPGMDGFTLVEKVRKNPQIPTLPMMILTSSGRNDDATRSKNLGVAAYLTKPITPSDLLDAIFSTLGLRKPRELEAEVSGAVTKSSRPLKILLAEDNLVNQRVALGILEKRGHAVSVANHGKEVLDWLQKADFELILMDIQMPELDGLQTTLKIREAEKKTGKHLIIIAMTAHATKEDEARCREVGMDGFLPKPVEPIALERTFAKFFPERLVAAPEPEVPGELKQGIDLIALAKRVDQDADLFKEISELFFEDAPRLLKEIESQMRAKDFQNLTRLAHALKGSISNFCAPEPFSLASQIEVASRAEETARVNAIFPQLQEKLGELILTLKSLGRENFPAKNSDVLI